MMRCVLVLMLLFAAKTWGEAIPVEIRTKDDGYQLYRGDQPYTVRGAGVAVDSEDALEMLQALKRHGGNSFRTWNVGDGWFLDAAHELGLSVALCLDIKRERHGYDYGDAEFVAAQLEQAREQVLRFKDHPALLAWVIGNELNYDYTDPRVYDAVNDISRMIHALDPHHPTTTTTADISESLARDIAERAPDIDFISVQTYGGLFDLPQRLETTGIDKPIMVTEWGTIGHWEVPKTPWGAPIELTSTQKAAAYHRGATEVLPQLGTRLIGSYVFLWGQKQERTPTWYGVFVDGHRTEAVDVLQRFWTGSIVENPVASVASLLLDGKDAASGVRLVAGRTYEANAVIGDLESDALRWVVLEESTAMQGGGDAEEVPADRSHMLQSTAGKQVMLTAPEGPGAYRLFVYAKDSNGGVAHANLPFFVETEEP